jgi:hypothetical protein
MIGSVMSIVNENRVLAFTEGFGFSLPIVRMQRAGLRLKDSATKQRRRKRCR